MNHSPFSFNNLPKAVKWLLISNIVFFILQSAMGGALENFFGLIPNRVWSSMEIWRLLTYLFLHGSFFHLLFNMFALWMFGRELENAWGTREFTKYYFICGIGAGLFNILFEPSSRHPIIGSSGALYGLLTAFAVVFPETVIYLYAIIPMRAKHFLILIGAIEFLASVQGAPSLVARFAHLGGIAAGYLYLKSNAFRSFFNRWVNRFLDSLVAKKSAGRKRVVPREEDLSVQVDKILEKILVHGEGSLTEKERETMRRYSSKKTKL